MASNLESENHEAALGMLERSLVEYASTGVQYAASQYIQSEGEKTSLP